MPQMTGARCTLVSSKNAFRVCGLLTYLLLLIGNTGCASSYKHVLVSVVDSKTGAPIAGAMVRTDYVKRRFSLASTLKSQAITDAQGHAVVVANYLPREPVLFGRSEDLPFGPNYRISISNDKYEADDFLFPCFTTNEPVFSRSPQVIPTNVDLTEDISSKADVERAEVDREQARRTDEQKAEELFQKSPNFWPEHQESPYEWVKDDVGRLLLFKRWKTISKVSLGTKEDVDSISKVVLQHMRNPKAKIGGIGWLSPTIVMVSSSWYEGPLASAGYTYVVQKSKNGWTVLAYYLEFVS